MADRGVEAAEKWLQEKGWAPASYKCVRSEVQSCPPDHVQVDVVRLPSTGDESPLSNTERVRASRLLVACDFFFFFFFFFFWLESTMLALLLNRTSKINPGIYMFPKSQRWCYFMLLLYKYFFVFAGDFDCDVDRQRRARWARCRDTVAHHPAGRDDAAHGRSRGRDATGARGPRAARGRGRGRAGLAGSRCRRRGRAVAVALGRCRLLGW
jgi:hypothetical protein